MGNEHLSFRKEMFLLFLVMGIFISLLFANAVQAQSLFWARQDGGESSEFSSDIVVDVLGNSYIIGTFGGSAPFGEGEVNETTLHSAGFIDIFVAKYDANGLLLWAKQAGGSELGQGFGIAVDGSGTCYITGTFEGVAIFGTDETNETILTSVGSRDIFIARYSANGTLLWAKRAGSNSDDRGRAITVDASNNSYVTGFFSLSSTFGADEENETTLTSNGSGDIFVAKYNTDGLLLWVKAAGGSFFDFAADISVDAFNNSYVTGFFEVSSIFGREEVNETTFTSAGLRDIFVAKYDEGGSLLWVKQAGGSDSDNGTGIAVDAFGNCYVTGELEGSVTFGEGEVGETMLDVTDSAGLFVAKYNVDGLLLWAKHADASVLEARGIAVNASGDCYITGGFEEIVTFGAGQVNETTLTTSDPRGLFLTKYNDEGLLLWVKQIAGGLRDHHFLDATDIALDASGNSYLAGGFQDAATFAKGETNETDLISAGATDIFIAKYGDDSPTSVDETSILVADFKLAQNYPNPFNPTTSLRYELNETAHVTLKIFNELGQEIRTLVYAKQGAGMYNVVWNGRNRSGSLMSSGVYLYQLQVGSSLVRRSMTLLK